MVKDATRLPFLQRLKLYLDERFPLSTHVVVVCAFFFSNFFLAERLVHPGSAVFGWRPLAGMITVLLSFFLLRIFDEFKDYETDVQAHPERIVSRGIMPLSELRIMGWTVFGLMVLLNLGMGPFALFGYLLVAGFSFLMFREFFVRAWLKRHLFTYAVTHQGITPLLCFYVYLLSLSAGFQWHGSLWLQFGMAAGTGLAWELSRKIRTADEEQPLIETYSRDLGALKASLLASGILLVGVAFALALGWLAAFPGYFYGTLGLGVLVTSVGFGRFWTAPTPKGARGLSDWAAVTMLLCYVAIAVGAVSGRGIALSF